MRYSHLEALAPVCPACLHGSGNVSPVKVATAAIEVGGHLLQGILRCDDPACSREYPVLDGIPYLVPDVRTYVADNLLGLLARDDLCEPLEDLIGDCCGQGGAVDATRGLLSTYGAGHYGGEAADDGATTDAPDDVATLTRRLLELGGGGASGHAIELGCSVGRSSFELAQHGAGLVLGVDVDPAMLRVASRALREGRISYPRRRGGIVYERRERSATFPGADRVDFWGCDATALPFADGTFGTVLAQNTLDSVRAPLRLLQEVGRVLGKGGELMLSTPYEWVASVTPIEAWMGGHSPRGDGEGRSEAILRKLLTPGAHPQSVETLALQAQQASVPWRLRMHDRHAIEFQVHLLVARRQD